MAAAGEPMTIDPSRLEGVAPAGLAGVADGQKKQQKKKNDKAVPKAGAQGGKKDGKGKGKWEAYSGPEGSGNGYRLNVKNISNELNDAASLKAYFSNYGTVVDAQVKARDDGSSRGFGFVIMSNENEANKAIEALNGKQVGGKALSVQPASRRAPAEADAVGKGGKGKGKSKSRPGEEYGDLSALMYNNWAAQILQQSSQMNSLQTLMQATMMGLTDQTQLQSLLAANSAYTNPAAAMNPYAAYAAAAQPFPPVSPAALSAANHGQLYGTLKSTSSKNGYGFIECNETYAQYNRDVYVDVHLLPKDAKPGAQLKFTINVNTKGQPKATNVEFA